MLVLRPSSFNLSKTEAFCRFQRALCRRSMPNDDSGLTGRHRHK